MTHGLPRDPLSGRLTIGFKTTPTDVDWATLDETWAAAGEEPVLAAGWMADHLTDATRERGGQAWEAFTLMAALAHRVPGRWLGQAVLANTFRHPAVLAKQATVMDHVTGGRFIVGLGAGWHEGEHEMFGIPLPPIGERISRLESAVAVLRALFGPEARREPGVSLDDPFYPLRGAVNDPPPVGEPGPPIWLGGQKRRGISLAARAASGWLMPGNRSGDTAYLVEKRDAMLRALEAAGRDPSGFTFAGQVATGSTGEDRRAALQAAREMVAAGASHVILGLVPRLGPENLRLVVREVAEPLAEEAGE
ncbi:MAG TPA: LLM class flavin-dependent oxidoreductase [candidate division Zixibacteria bacterium]|nr:LLM class flavin-dependent oxidoreductase [candidate division Zixibacteria bacterium]